MLVIRMQRTGRKGHAQFRVVVQDSRRTPTSGKIVAAIGSYDPHTKTVRIDKEKVSFYMEHGAQPSPRVVRLLKADGVKLPDWVKQSSEDKQRTTRNADKRRSTMPPAPKEEAPAEAPAEAELPSEEVAAPATEVTEAPEATPEAAVETEAPSEETAETPAAEPEAAEASETEASAEEATPVAEEPATTEPEAEAAPAADTDDSK